MGAPERVTTPRLTGERPAAEHLPGLAALLGDPHVGSALWPGDLGGARTLDQVAALVRADAARWECDGFGPWAFRDRATREVVARGGLATTSVDAAGEVELLYAVRSDRWREGLAGEIASASIRVAFTDLGLPSLVGYVLGANLASRAVLRRAGFTLDREFEHAGLAHLLMRLPAP